VEPLSRGQVRAAGGVSNDLPRRSVRDAVVEGRLNGNPSRSAPRGRQGLCLERVAIPTDGSTGGQGPSSPKEKARRLPLSRLCRPPPDQPFVRRCGKMARSRPDCRASSQSRWRPVFERKPTGTISGNVPIEHFGGARSKKGLSEIARHARSSGPGKGERAVDVGRVAGTPAYPIVDQALPGPVSKARFPHSLRPSDVSDATILRMVSGLPEIGASAAWNSGARGAPSPPGRLQRTGNQATTSNPSRRATAPVAECQVRRSEGR